MLRTPEAVKKGLECCGIRKTCYGCPYENNTLSTDCMNLLEADALAYIKRLEDKETGGAERAEP